MPNNFRATTTLRISFVPSYIRQILHPSSAATGFDFRLCKSCNLVFDHLLLFG